MRTVRIMCTHVAGCSLAGNQRAEGSGSSPSPPWTLSPARSPPAVRLGPFPLTQTQDRAGRTNAVRKVLTVVQASHPLQSPIIHSASGWEQQQWNLGPPASVGPKIQMGQFSEAAGSSWPRAAQTTHTLNSTATQRHLLYAGNSGLLCCCSPVWMWLSFPLTNTSADRLPLSLSATVSYSKTNMTPSGHCCLSLSCPSPSLSLSLSFGASALHRAELRSLLLTQRQFPPNISSHSTQSCYLLLLSMPSL